MKRLVFGLALAAACTTALAQDGQTRSGTGIGANTGGSSSINIPPPPAPPSTGTSGDTAGLQGTSPRGEGSSVGAGGTVLTPDNIGRTSGRCDTLTGDERSKCLREQASTGTTGPTSTGMGR